MNTIFFKKETVIEAYGLETLIVAYMILDQFNNTDVNYYHYDYSNGDYDLTKMVNGKEEESQVTLFTQVPDYIAAIANAIVYGKIHKAVRICKKNNLPLKINKLMNAHILLTGDDREYRTKLYKLFTLR
jgi:hypothetical protein